MSGNNSKWLKVHRWLLPLRILFWMAFTAILFIAGVIISAVIVLTPERLTTLTESVANRMLNADVSVERVELSIRSSMPFMNLDVDSLVIASRDIRALPPAVRDTLPEWSDTLLSVGHLHGGINIFKVLRGKIDLKNLQVCRPQVNILVVNEKLNNFSISKPSEEAPDTTALTVPDIRLDHFALIDPRVIRFADLSQDIRAAAIITSADLANHPDNDDFLPLYNIDFDSNVSSPLFEILGQKEIPIGFNGIVDWRHDEPYMLGLEKFKYGISLLSGEINTKINFFDQLTVENFDFTINPVKVSEFLSMVPDSELKDYKFIRQIRTDATISANGRLSKPYIVGSAELPYAELAMDMPECTLKWQHLDLHRLQINLGLSLRGHTLNEAVLTIPKLLVAGPATTLQLNGKVTELLGDPLFNGKINGDMVLDNLPDVITNMMGGAIRGYIKAETDVVARPSMFDRDNFHRLKVAGDVEVKNFYYLSDDTLSLYSAHKATAHFGSNESIEGRSGTKLDSLLSAKVLIDSVYILVSGLDIHIDDFRLGVGAQNRQASTDTTAIIPMGGGLSVGNFSLFSMGDSAGVRIRGLKGNISMRRYKDDAHLPLFKLNAKLNNISAGNNHTRFMVSNGQLNLNANKLSDNELPAPRRELRRLTDSISHRHPDIPLDSVYNMALEIRRRNHRKGHRVHKQMTAENNEIIYWGTSSSLARILLDWKIGGKLTAQTARLFSPSFPVRNKVENLNITFDNDSIALTNVAYKAGRSDFLISGTVSNLKRAFTSKLYRQPLKINFDMVSDLIDVNEIANAFFTGAANKDAKLNTSISDDKKMQDDIDKEVKTDTVGPLLIPVNIDAELNVRAKNVSYSDILLNDFRGTLLLYDGALNLHNLSATSAVGSVKLSALYSAPNANDMNFGFGMKLSDFNIGHFLDLVPAVDSIMPLMRDLSGIISADIAATSKIDRHMDFVMPTLKAAINIQGDSLVLIDPETYKTIAKWLLFKDKNNNMINHVLAEMLVENDQLQVFPFIFDFDRYKLGIQGHNDLDMNFDYHIAVLKSPIPFKFGINIKGSPEKYKIRLGRARFNDKTVLNRTLAVDTTRVNLINQFENIFRRGVRRSEFANVQISNRPLAEEIDLDADTLSSADSLYFKQEGLIPADLP